MINSTARNIHDISKTEYQHVVKSVFKLNSVKEIPKGYVIHHKDSNHYNNMANNLVLLPKSTHRKLHTIFGNILLNALHTGRINRNTFFTICNEEQSKFYENIIDLSILSQVIVDDKYEDCEMCNNYKKVYRQ